MFPPGSVTTGDTEKGDRKWSWEGWEANNCWPHSKDKHSEHSAWGTLTDRHAESLRQAWKPRTNRKWSSPPPWAPFCFLSHTGNGCLSWNLALPPLNTLEYITRHLWTALESQIPCSALSHVLYVGPNAGWGAKDSWPWPPVGSCLKLSESWLMYTL